MPSKWRNRQACLSTVLLTLGCLITSLSSSSRALAQTPASPGKCEQPPILYAIAKYKVEHVTVKPMVKFVSDASVLDDALAAAIAINAPGSNGVWTSREFDTHWPSLLESDLNDQLERRILVGRMGLIFAHHHLINCDETNRTMDVQYEVLTVARPSYLRNTFEARDRRQRNKEAAGTLEEKAKNYSLVPFAGYNRSRGIFGGSEVALETNYKPLSKLALSASGSSSSAVAEFGAAGSKNFDHGPLSFAEWRAAYRYSNIPTDGFDLKDATGAARFFAATRPITSRNLIFRVGASVEGGNRQSSLPQALALPDTLVDSGYGALKLYAGASLTTRRQDLKASYGLHLGNTGENLSVDYRKQIFDAAYRLRFLPKPYKPFQLDAQFTAGSLTTVSGPVPYGERFFGGNVEQEFIQGDSWKIRSNPVIRSFPQNRLNGTGGSIPVGGDDFLSFNFTAAQTIWQKQLIPREISEDPDLTLAMGTQLLTARLVFREEAVRASKQIKELEAQVGCADTDPSKHCLTPVINRLKTLLNNLLAQAGSDDQLKQAINSFSDDDGSNPMGDAEDAIGAAKIDPEAAKKVIENAAEAQGNPVEANVTRLIKDDFGDPDDPDDDTPSLLTIVQSHITKLQPHLTAPVFSAARIELQTINGAIDQDKATLQQRLDSVNTLRAYTVRDVQAARESLDQPAGSGRKLDEVLVDIRSLLKPERERVQARIKELNLQLSQMSDADPKTAEIKKLRDTFFDYQDLLDAADSFAEKAKNSSDSVRASFEAKDYEGVKIFMERLAAGFGGLLSYLTGVEIKIQQVETLLRQQGMPPLPDQINIDAADVRLIEHRTRAAYNKIRIPPAEITANKTVSYVGRVLEVFFRETNIVAVSPVIMFDAARLHVAELPGSDRLRYGIGSGLRFSLINVDFTAGYSFNPTRRLNEPRGAFVFRMDINDLFK